MHHSNQDKHARIARRKAQRKARVAVTHVRPTRAERASEHRARMIERAQEYMKRVRMSNSSFWRR